MILKGLNTELSLHSLQVIVCHLVFCKTLKIILTKIFTTLFNLKSTSVCSALLFINYFQLGLHHDTIATGVVFYHRFYMFHSFKKFPRHVTATCCLFLAGKVEETPKKCK